MLPSFALVLLLAAAPAAPATVPMPKAGSFGFNWLDAKSHCKKLTAKDLAPIKACERSNNAFGLDTNPLMCKVSAKVELVIYDTAAQCQEGLETMQANGD
jgi:hypothetical protein